MASVAIDNVNVPNHPSGDTTSTTIRDRPEASHGYLIGYGTKRFVVELLTSTGAIWGPTGSTVWGPTGTAVWGGSKTWLDVTDDVTGFAINQRGSGSTISERPNPATFTLTLQNPDDAFSTWKADVQPYVGPGAIFRVGINDPLQAASFIGWQPLILGTVESITDDATEVDAYRYVTLTLVEPHSDLAKIDGYEQIAVGASEALFPRIARLLDEARYRFGTEESDIVNTAGASSPFWAAPLQSTNLAQNRLTEIYLTVDSCDSQFVSAKTGQPQIIPMPTPGNLDRTNFYTDSNVFGYAYPALGTGTDTITAADLDVTTTPSTPVAVMPWATISTTADNDAIVNKVVLARAGGTLQTRSTAAPRTGPSIFSRADLILSQDVDVGALAQAILSRGINAGQYLTVQVDAHHDDRLVDWLAQLDMYQKVDVLRTFERDAGAQAKDLIGIVLGYSMAITPLASERIVWTATVNLQIVQVNNYTAP